jgi:fumarate reductase iron-sulfur subunit
MAPEKVTFEVFRYSPEGSASQGEFQSYEVPYNEEWVVLDALNYIKDELDGSLSYRWSCRMGVCGSCGMMVNRRSALTCATFLRDLLPGPIRVEPLDYFPVVRDLVIEMDGFMEKLTDVKPWLIRKEEKPLEDGEYLQTPAELGRYKQFSMCINCLLCYSACPVVGMEEDFTGPAAIALAHRYNLDSRDQGFEDRRAALFSHEAVWNCTFIGECSVVCPKGVDPAAAIQQAKLDATKSYFLSKLLPWKGEGRPRTGRGGEE